MIKQELMNKPNKSIKQINGAMVLAVLEMGYFLIYGMDRGATFAHFFHSIYNSLCK